MNFEPERRMSRKAEKRETAGRMDGTQVPAKLFDFSVVINGREAPKNLRTRILVGAKRPRNLRTFSTGGREAPPKFKNTQYWWARSAQLILRTLVLGARSAPSINKNISTRITLRNIRTLVLDFSMFL